MSVGMRKVLVIAAVLLATGCSAAGEASKIVFSRDVPVGQEFDLKIGEVVHVAKTTTIVAFDAVLEDSRCPMNARCIWEGNAKVSVRIGDMSAASWELNTSERFETRHQTSDYDFVIVNLQPVPMAGEKVKEAEYVLTMRVEAKP